jgi:hypothetical protein
MIDESRSDLSIKSPASKVLAKKNKIEGSDDFSKKNIKLAFADVDEQLKQLAQDDSMSKVRRFITIQEIRNRIFEVGSLYVHHMDVRKFASHEPADKTPVNSECC